MKPSKKTETTPKKKNRLEWAVFGLSTLLLLGVIGVLVHQAVTVGEEPAHLVVRLGEPLTSSDQVRVPVTVVNTGDEPALAVRVEIGGTLSGVEHSSSLSIDHVPHRSNASGWVSFPGSVIPGNLTAHVVGYMDR
jgi:uncharacterized protein (TIGR02588 family)